MADRDLCDTVEPRYTHCPICGGVLQATVSIYVTNCVVAANGDLLDYDDEDAEHSMDEFRVYCENDCTWDEISQELDRHRKPEKNT